MEPDASTSQTDKRTQTERIVPSGGKCQCCLQRREIADVLIIGAGAAGIAVALSVLEKVCKGWPMDSMMMVEKSDEAGRGTAYSSAMDGTMCNRRDDEMSLMHDQPNHFRDWAQEQREKIGRIRGDHCKRQVYGDYLQDMLRKVNMVAFDQMVDFRFIRQGAVDMDRYTDGDATIYGVKLEDGCSVYAKNVVLALGNFLKESKLSGTPGYFSSPWPLAKLNEIPKTAAVGIMGTGAAAFEVLAKLHSEEHQGMIYMMSASGRLPRLERPPRSFPAHAVHAAIRGLEARKTSLETFLGFLENLLRQHEDVRTSGGEETSFTYCASGRLLSDMQKFDLDERRSLVVDALRPVAERIWTSAAPLEREDLRSHPVWEEICKETIPANMAAMYTMYTTRLGKLEVIQDVDVGKKQGYFLMGRNERAEVDYVVDASGLEYDLSEIKFRSPLLREMRKKGLATDEPAGGIKVGVASHQLTAADDKPAPGLYAIGSLTKGTHFFVEDVGRLAAHALRISDSLVGLPRSSPTQVALFVGGDLFSTVILANVVPALLARGHMPYVFLVEPAATDAADADADAESLYVAEKEWLYWYFETAVVPALVSDLQKNRDGSPQLALATDAVENAYGVLVQRVRDLNDPDFLASLAPRNVDIGFVVGCGERTRVEDGLRNAFHLFRVQAGLAPSYHSTREVLRAGGEGRFGYTLHRLGARGRDEDIYPDSFFASKDRSIRDSPCACTAMFDSYGLAVELVTGTVDRYARGQLQGSPQRNTTPLPDDGRDGEVALVTLPAMMERVLSQFATPKSEDRLIRDIAAGMKRADTRELVAWKAERRARRPTPGSQFI
ncbi:hypothetical protein Hte_007567 [Hypoxylon texense]